MERNVAGDDGQRACVHCGGFRRKRRGETESRNRKTREGMAQEANFPAEPQVYGDVSDMLYVFPLSDVELLRTPERRACHRRGRQRQLHHRNRRRRRRHARPPRPDASPAHERQPRTARFLPRPVPSRHHRPRQRTVLRQGRAQVGGSHRFAVRHDRRGDRHLREPDPRRGTRTRLFLCRLVLRLRDMDRSRGIRNDALRAP